MLANAEPALAPPTLNQVLVPKFSPQPTGARLSPPQVVPRRSSFWTQAHGVPPRLLPTASLGRLTRLMVRPSRVPRAAAARVNLLKASVRTASALPAHLEVQRAVSPSPMMEENRSSTFHAMHSMLNTLCATQPSPAQTLGTCRQARGPIIQLRRATRTVSSSSRLTSACRSASPVTQANTFTTT